jgi:phage terminase large subunit-like protein
MVEAGNVYLPHPMLVSWVEALLEEMPAFPKGRHDDQVDAMTQALKTGFGRAAGYSISRNRRFSSIRLKSQRNGHEPSE